jgi:hypothetical protein
MFWEGATGILRCNTNSLLRPTLRSLLRVVQADLNLQLHSCKCLLECSITEHCLRNVYMWLSHMCKLFKLGVLFKYKYLPQIGSIVGWEVDAELEDSTRATITGHLSFLGCHPFFSNEHYCAIVPSSRSFQICSVHVSRSRFCVHILKVEATAWFLEVGSRIPNQCPSKFEMSRTRCTLFHFAKIIKSP